MPDELSQDDIDALLASAGGSDSSEFGGDLGALLGTPEPANLPEFGDIGVDENVEPASIEMLYDVDLNVKIELGRTYMSVEDVLRLREGSVVQLDKDAGAPVDILVNDRLVAFGEVLVLNDYFCVRVTEILSDKDRTVVKR